MDLLDAKNAAPARGRLRPKSKGGMPHVGITPVWARSPPMPIKFGVKRPSATHISQSLNAQQSSSIAYHSTCTLLDLAPERLAILSLNRSDCLSCFHSSASASQYFISEYSISLRASAACSRHIASNAVNCFFEYMVFPIFTQFIIPFAYQGQLTML